MKKILFILGELSDRDMDWLLLVGRKEHLPAGRKLIQEGRAIDALYIVLSGILQVSVESAKPKDEKKDEKKDDQDDQKDDREISQLSSGEVVGEISFLDARPPLATVTALQDSLVFAIPREQLQRKLEEDSEFAAHFYRAIALFLADRMRNMLARLGYGHEYPSETHLQRVQDLSPIVVENLPRARTRLEQLVTRLRGY
jgi:CRP/FNR family transcriptional regulator, cyclic AMP receptor protein